MTKLAWIIIGVLFGALITVTLLWQIQGCNYKKNFANVNTQLYNCQHAPIQIHDSIHDSIVYRDRWLEPKPIPYPVHDTSYIDTVKPKLCIQYYDDSIVVFSGKLRGVVKYRAVSKDCKLFINPYKSIFPIDYRIETKTVHDTIPVYYPKTHYLIGGSLMGNDFKRFPNFNLNFGVSLKDIVILRIGGEYNVYHGEAYVIVGADVFLEKRK